VSARAMTKSGLDLARTALAAAEGVLTPYSHPNSRKTYTQPQLFALLAVRRFFGLDYRAAAQLVKDWSDLREALGLKELPHFTTLQKAEARLLKKGAPTASSTRRSASRASAA
jgi:hypothetical protein